MKTINWKDEFSVGVTEFDNQHKKLIGMVNRLIADQKELTDPAMVADLLTEMTDYAEEHFRAEEHLMYEYNYDRKEQQEQEHKAFIEKTRTFTTVEIGPNLLSTALLDYLSSWLINHILQEDMRYKDFFENKGLN